MNYFHGTKSNFNRFTQKGNGKHGEGFYFTADYQEAKQLAFSLAGIGGDEPKVFTVSLSFSNLFNTLNENHALLVMNHLGLSYKIPKNIGEYGNQEHYNYLIKQILKNGFSVSEINSIIQQAGFDGIIYDFMNHVIIFNEDSITIESIDLLVK